MENSAKVVQQVPSWARLRRDKSNYVAWQRAITDVLEAMGCDQAISKDFAKLQLHADDDYDDSSSSDEDSDDLPGQLSDDSPELEDDQGQTAAPRSSSTSSSTPSKLQHFSRK